MKDLPYWISGLLTLAGIVIYVAFGRDTPDEARGRIHHGLLVLTSWPGRFIRYRSGHGRHCAV